MINSYRNRHSDRYFSFDRKRKYCLDTYDYDKGKAEITCAEYVIRNRDCVVKATNQSDSAFTHPA